MQKLRVSDIETAERLLDALRDKDLELPQLARLIGPLGPVSDRLRSVASARARRNVPSTQDAVMLLGAAQVEAETFALVAEWLETVERNGASRVLPLDERSARALTPPVSQRRFARGA